MEHYFTYICRIYQIINNLKFMAKEEENFIKQVGINILTIRKSRKISQDELSKKVGISRGRLIRIEYGENPTDILTLWKIAKELGISPRELMDVRGFSL